MVKTRKCFTGVYISTRLVSKTTYQGDKRVEISRHVFNKSNGTSVTWNKYFNSFDVLIALHDLLSQFEHWLLFCYLSNNYVFYLYQCLEIIIVYGMCKIKLTKLILKNSLLLMSKVLQNYVKKTLNEHVETLPFDPLIVYISRDMFPDICRVLLKYDKNKHHNYWSTLAIRCYSQSLNNLLISLPYQSCWDLWFPWCHGHT